MQPTNADPFFGQLCEMHTQAETAGRGASLQVMMLAHNAGHIFFSYFQIVPACQHRQLENVEASAKSKSLVDSSPSTRSMPTAGLKLLIVMQVSP